MPTTYLLMVNVLSLLMIAVFYLLSRGKMGASLHRSMREKAIGGEPPYLMVPASCQFFFIISKSLIFLCIFIGSQPFFGMFGYGGPVAAMCLGRYKLCELFIFTHKNMKHLVHSVFLLFISLLPLYSFLKHYCRRAVVSSKTKQSNKVFTLHMEREALVSASHLENCWKVIDCCTFFSLLDFHLFSYNLLVW